MNIFRLLATVAVAAVCLQGAASAAPEAPRYGAWGFDLKGEDVRVKPGDDFYRYANGTYIDTLELPADRARVGMFDGLSTLSQQRLRAIIEEEVTHPGPDPDEQKIADLYRAYMDTAAIEKRGSAPLTQELDGIRAIKTRADFISFMGTRHGFGGSVFNLRIGNDAKDPEKRAVSLSTGGLGAGNREYYLSPNFASQKAAYEAYVAKLLKLSGWADPEGSAKAIVAFETRLAEATWTRAESRNRDRTYNPMMVADLPKYAPGFDWPAYFASSGLSDVTRVIATDNTALPKFAAIYAETPVETLKAWEAFRIADAAAPYLPKAFSDTRFEFRSKVLSGVTEEPERWKQGVGAVNGVFGGELGRIYLKRYFSDDARAKAEALVGDIKTALKARIEHVAWMTPETRAKALDKLDKMKVKIAFPTSERGRRIEIKADDLYGDMERLRQVAWERQVERLRRPGGRDNRPGMSPQTVNASYNAQQNQITIPAAILQAPFFDANADPAVNYGGSGGVSGHEMTHGFDDQGRKSDGLGRLIDWWGPADGAAFQARADHLGEQYSAFEPIPGSHIDGKLTMGENIADLGGLLLALVAYHASLHGMPAPVIDGLTCEQRVFLGWAQVWRAKSRPDALRRQLISDPHSPPEARVNAVVRNVDAWYAAFNVKPGDRLYVPPEQRVRLW